MPKFSADTIGGALEFDFSTWAGPKGVVPEPSRVAVNRMMKEINAAFKELGLRDEDNEEDLTADELVQTMDKVEDEETFEKLTERLLTILAEICSGTPTLDQLTALPYRPFMGFFGYLIGNLTNPEGSAPGTNNSRTRLRSV